ATPASGAPTGGTSVTLTGSAFSKNNAGTCSVAFGGKPAGNVVILSDTSLRCFAPSGLGGTVVDVTVANANGSGTLEAGFRYQRPPVLTALEPVQGDAHGGPSVTLRGNAVLQVGAGPAPAPVPA